MIAKQKKDNKDVASHGLHFSGFLRLEVQCPGRQQSLAVDLIARQPAGKRASQRKAHNVK